jgi:hypothetical protein
VREAVQYVRVARSWFPSEDQSFLLCALHAAYAHAGQWAALYADLARIAVSCEKGDEKNE